MHIIGIDVGSTYTKYCVMQDGKIVNLFSERTPVRQAEYFDNKLQFVHEKYPDASIVSCGYGKKNVQGIKEVNELTALAAGVYYVTESDCVILDIGGQDTKIIRQEKGKLKEFFINDKCAAGSGMFLVNTLNLLGLGYDDIELSDNVDSLSFSSTCAVFTQSEMVELIADNVNEKDIINAAIRQIFVKSKKLMMKIKTDFIVLTGGLSQIKDIDQFASTVIDCKCICVDNGNYLSALGCTLLRGKR